MATPDHTARARASFLQDGYLAFIPDSSHRANLTRHPHGTAPPALSTRLGDNHVVHGRRRVTLHATHQGRHAGTGESSMRARPTITAGANRAVRYRYEESASRRLA